MLENKENSKYLSFSVSVTRTSSRVASDRILFSANTFDLSPRPICGLQKAVEACCRRVRLGFSARDLSARGRTASRFFPSEKRRNAFRAFSRPRFWGLPCQADAESAHDVNATLFLSFSSSRDPIFFTTAPTRSNGRLLRFGCPWRWWSTVARGARTCARSLAHSLLYLACL